MAEIGVRALDGSTTTTTLSPDNTIGDLKAALLKDSFPPAMAAPCFHLFFKGAKLSEEGRVGAVPLKEGEFMVLVPFAKRKRRSETNKDVLEHSAMVPSRCGEGENRTNYAADSAWADLMQDVASLSNAPVCGPSSSGIVPSKDTMASSSSDHGRENVTNQLIHDIIFSDGGNGGGPQTREKFCRVVDAVGCLADGLTGKCMFFRELCKDKDEVEQCMCPSWLKRLVKCFAFVNIFYGLRQMQHRCLTWNCLKEALSESDGFGIGDVSISDVEHLLVLCSKVVVVVPEGGVLPKSRDSVIIFDVLAESQNSRLSLKCKKRMSSLSIFKALEKRDNALRRDLWKSIKCLMEKSTPESSFLSLNDLIVMNQHNLKGPRVSSKRSRAASESRCCSTNFLQPEEMVEHLRTGFGSHGQIIHVEEIDANPAVFAELPSSISETTKETLNGMGICKLYSHQVDAIQASLDRKHVVVATSTSSGKSMCYNFPVIEEMSKSLASCALYLFPTKALAQDQLRSLVEMTKGSNINLNVGVYDGDTFKDHRIWLRDNARLLITNPDMLHVTILPHHGQFQRILSNLSYVVIDEAHTYNGAFGCHTALILRRLRRLCSHVYGSDPSFIFCSATSANPREHVMELANLRNVELIQNDGSPCGSKLFLLWNPSARSANDLKSAKIEHKVAAAVARRPSPILETSRLFAEMVQHGLRCIAFCKTRKLCELVLCYTHEILKHSAPILVDSVSSYRGGYTIEDRRRIETDLFSGKLRGVAATNALELGIDVGYIDATLHLGFPGSIASLWQQAGRSGRRARPSLAVYIAFEGPLDQYFMKCPRKLFDSQIEFCLVDPHNQQLLEQHLACAAFEHPLNLNRDKRYFGSSLNSAVSALLNKGYLCGDSRGISSTKILEYIGPEKSPSHAVSIRAIEINKYKIFDLQSNDIIEEIEESRAFFQVYEGAVYIHQGITYLVKTLDLSEKVAFCQRADLKYYTKTRDYTDIHVVGGDLAYPPSNGSNIQYLKTTAQVHKCNVTTCWFGFYRIHHGSNKIFDRVDLSLPRYSYESQAVWIRVPQSIKLAVEIHELSFRAGQHAASHALLNVVPLYLMCNSSDLSAECANPHENRDIPERILLYDQCPGGIGISVQVQHLFNELLAASLELVAACNCASNAGCPNCIQSLSCNEYNEVLDKKAAIMILQGVIDSEKYYFRDK